MAIFNLLDLETMYAIKKAAPQITSVAFDLAGWVVCGLDALSKVEKLSMDLNKTGYWQATVKDIHKACRFDEAMNVSLNLVGRALKEMGLESWRKGDGFHVAWSENQLAILKNYFKKSSLDLNAFEDLQS
jgi:hypothetical protein